MERNRHTSLTNSSKSVFALTRRHLLFVGKTACFMVCRLTTMSRDTIIQHTTHCDEQAQLNYSAKISEIGKD